MSTKRDLDTRDSLKVVTSMEFVRACGLENISLKARKLLYLAIAQCRLNDSQFFEYSISVQELATLLRIDSSNLYRQADEISDELMRGFIKIVPPGKKRFKKFHLFDRCIYEDSQITFELHRDMTDICLALKRDFCQPLLSDFLPLRSNYSIILFHYFFCLMRRYPSTKRVDFYCTLAELRKVTGCEDKFTQLVNFRCKVLDRALRDIYEGSGVLIEYEDVKRGRSVIGFNFSATMYGIDLSAYTPSIEVLSKVDEFKKRQQNIS